MAAKKTKSLKRSSTNSVIAGVCGGLGEFFDLDPTIIRIIFILIILFGGSGIFLYLILWLLMPKSAQGITDKSIREGVDEMRDSAQKMADNAKKYAERTGNRRLFGYILLGLGILFLLQNFGFWRFFNVFKLWPLFLIAIAIAMLAKND